MQPAVAWMRESHIVFLLRGAHGEVGRLIKKNTSKPAILVQISGFLHSLPRVTPGLVERWALE